MAFSVIMTTYKECFFVYPGCIFIWRHDGTRLGSSQSFAQSTVVPVKKEDAAIPGFLGI